QAGDEMHRIDVDPDLRATTRLYTDPLRSTLYVLDADRVIQLDVADSQAPQLRKRSLPYDSDPHFEFSPDGTRILTHDLALRVDTLRLDPDYPLLIGNRVRWSRNRVHVWSLTQDMQATVYNERALVMTAQYRVVCPDSDERRFSTYRSISADGDWA